MHRRLLTALILVLLTAGTARADINTFLERLDASARIDMTVYRTRLSTDFGATKLQLDAIFRSVARPAEAVVCLWLKQRTNRPLADILYAYRIHQGQGWGQIAQGLGIKPGSADFKALKRGDLGWPIDGAAKNKVNGKKQRR